MVSCPGKCWTPWWWFPKVGVSVVIHDMRESA